MREFLKRENQQEYRFPQIYQAVFKNLIFDFDKMTILPQSLREKLKSQIKIFSLKLLKIQKSKDTEKALFGLSDGLSIETVLMRHKDGRKTVCVSSAAGCSVGCKFCATGKLGFKRNLVWQEIVDQVLFFAEKEKDKKLNIVFMGMGEPFLNYEDVLNAIRILNDKKGFNLRARAISVSTSGVIPGIERFQKEKLEVNLAISLHGADDEIRSSLMPINKVYPLKDLITAAKNYVKTTKRKLFFEYLMLKGVNDDVLSAQKLARVLGRETLFHINLIRYNETGTGFKGSDEKTILNFQKELQKHHLKATIRHSFGEEIEAACGQLAAKL